ncbi:hypothetical protein D3C84_974080 [compost metagenome]
MFSPGYHGAHLGVTDAVIDVLAGEHFNGRDRNRAQLQAADHRHLPVRNAREHDQHPIAPAYAAFGQHRSEPVGEA